MLVFVSVWGEGEWEKVGGGGWKKRVMCEDDDRGWVAVASCQLCQVFGARAQRQTPVLGARLLCSNSQIVCQKTEKTKKRQPKKARQLKRNRMRNENLFYVTSLAWYIYIYLAAQLCTQLITLMLLAVSETGCPSAASISSSPVPFIWRLPHQTAELTEFDHTCPERRRRRRWWRRWSSSNYLNKRAMPRFFPLFPEFTSSLNYC